MAGHEQFMRGPREGAHAMTERGTTTHIVRRGDARLSVTVRGDGDAVVLLPSLGRGPDDFSHLAQRLVDAGYCTLLPAPRGIGDSTGPLQDLTLHDLAADVAAIIETLAVVPVFIVGHAFGSRVARMLAANRPDLVRAAALLACGGEALSSPAIMLALQQSFALDLPDEERLAAVHQAYFAAASSATLWRVGWFPEAAAAQVAAMVATDQDAWWAGGDAPLLVIQGTEDAVASPGDDGRALKDALGARVRLLEITHAGHALLPEQPDAIAEAITTFFAEH